MSSIVTVAPREIGDAVRRACRVQRLDAGIADRVAANVRFGEIHGGGAVEAFVLAIGRGALSPFAAAPDLVAVAEVNTRRAGSGTTSFDPPVAAVAVADALWQATQRGATCAEIEAGRLPPGELAELQLRATAVSTDVVAAFADRTEAAGTHGVIVGATWWAELERLASNFPVDEAILDAIAD
jgi:hypothetical protein